MDPPVPRLLWVSCEAGSVGSDAARRPHDAMFCKTGLLSPRIWCNSPAQIAARGGALVHMKVSVSEESRIKSGWAKAFDSRQPTGH